MDSIEFTQAKKVARLRYESSRLRKAAMGFTPLLLLLVPIAVLAGGHTGAGIIVGVGLFVLGTGLLWYGQQLKRAVLPGVIAGLFPMSFALCANNMKHGCLGDCCVSLCVPACVAGGLVAGAIITVVIYRQRRSLGFWVAAAGMGALTGSLGCSCAGHWGVVGLMAGLLATSLPGLVKAVRSSDAAAQSPTSW